MKKACTERSRSGFTLIELLVVVSIIGVLSVVGVNIFKEATKTARDNLRRQDLKKLSLALEVYLQKNTFYIKPGVGSCKTDTIIFNDKNLGIAPTMAGNIVPHDPITTNYPDYCYISNSIGDSYRLFTKLEKPSTSDPNYIDCPPDYNWTLFSENLKPACPGPISN